MTLLWNGGKFLNKFVSTKDTVYKSALSFELPLFAAIAAENTVES